MRVGQGDGEDDLEGGRVMVRVRQKGALGIVCI